MATLSPSSFSLTSRHGSTAVPATLSRPPATYRNTLRPRGAGKSTCAPARRRTVDMNTPVSEWMGPSIPANVPETRFSAPFPSAIGMAGI